MRKYGRIRRPAGDVLHPSAPRLAGAGRGGALISRSVGLRLGFAISWASGRETEPFKRGSWWPCRSLLQLRKVGKRTSTSGARVRYGFSSEAHLLGFKLQLSRQRPWVGQRSPGQCLQCPQCPQHAAVGSQGRTLAMTRWGAEPPRMPRLGRGCAGLCDLDIVSKPRRPAPPWGVS